MTVDTITEATRLGSYQPGSPEWEDLRRNRLGGSEISAVLGLSPYDSPLGLWFRKRGLASPKPSSEAMDWGNRLERVVFDRFVEDHSHAEWIYQPGSYVAASRPWHLASPDAMSPSGTALVEIKTTQYDFEWGEPGTDQIPLGYRCQVLWNMSCLGADHAWVPVLIRGCTYREYLVERDDAAEEDIAILLDAGAKFVQSLVDDVAPAIDGHDETYRTIREQNPDIEPGDIDIDGGLADAYIAAVLEEKAAKEIKQRWASEIMQAMGKIRNAIHEQTQERFAFRKPASNGQRIPFLAADPALIRKLKPAHTIKEAN